MTNISPRLKDWITWLLEPDITKRPNSAKEALNNIDRSSNNPAAVKPNFSISPKVSSQITLTHQENALAFEIPRKQLNFSLIKKRQLGCTGFLVLFILCIVVSPWILWLLLCFGLYKLIKRLWRNIFGQKIEFYSLQLKQSNNHFDVYLFGDKIKNKNFVQHGVLRAISAGPNTPKYQFNIYTNESKIPISIKGNRTEIQWICDEINEWTGLEIEYEDFTA